MILEERVFVENRFKWKVSVRIFAALFFVFPFFLKRKH